MTSLLLNSILLLLLLVPCSEGVRYGDEQYGNFANGVFYVFATGAIRIVNPRTGDIVKTLPADGVSWGDMVYVNDQARSKHYVFASDGANGKVWVIDTDSQEVISRTAVGQAPEQVYSIVQLQSVWAHLDKAAAFATVDLDNISRVAGNDIPARSSTQVGPAWFAA